MLTVLVISGLNLIISSFAKQSMKGELFFVFVFTFFSFKTDVLELSASLNGGDFCININQPVLTEILYVFP